MPSPIEMLLRTAPSPVPTYTTSGLSGRTATAPIESVPPSSKTGSKVVPPFVDLKSPEDEEPTYRMLRLSGMPATSEILPENMAGPISRQERPARTAPSPTSGFGPVAVAAEGAPGGG